MGQRVYILSLENKWNVVGIYTNIRQVHKSVIDLKLENLDGVFLQEIRMNEVPKKDIGKDVKYMLIQKQEQMEKHRLQLLAFEIAQELLPPEERLLAKAKATKDKANSKKNVNKNKDKYNPKKKKEIVESK
jgi:3-methyladenine DNA glycosylase AlkC